MAYSQNDIATIKARIEFSIKGGAQVVYTDPEGNEHRAQVGDEFIIGVEPGPLKAGDVVTKGKGKTIAKGVVVHRVEDMCWVSWADGPALEPVDGLSR